MKENTNLNKTTFQQIIKYLKRKYLNTINHLNKIISKNAFRIYTEEIRYSEDYGMLN